MGEPQVRCKSTYSFRFMLRANSMIVLPPLDAAIHNTPPTPPPDFRPPPPHLRPHELPPRRPHPAHLRPPRKLLRCNPLHLPLQDRTLCLLRHIILVVHPNADSYKHMGEIHNLHVEINRLPRPSTTRPLTTSGLAARGGGRMGSRYGV